MRIKPKVDEYDAIIYPRKLWIATKLEGLDDIFAFCKLTNTYIEDPETYNELKNDKDKDGDGAVTVPVFRKSDGSLGVLVIIYSKEQGSNIVNTIAHESVHVADYFYQDLGIMAQEFRDGNESYAYLVGWAAGCMSSSLARKAKDLN